MISIHDLINEWWIIEFYHLNIFLIPSSFSKFMNEINPMLLNFDLITLKVSSTGQLRVSRVPRTLLDILVLYTSCSKLSFPSFSSSLIVNFFVLSFTGICEPWRGFLPNCSLSCIIISDIICFKTELTHSFKRWLNQSQPDMQISTHSFFSFTYVGLANFDPASLRLEFVLCSL